MFNLKSILSAPYGFYDYIWIDCTLIRETPKAILIDFDNRKIWLPKVWVVEKRNRTTPVILSPKGAKNLGIDSPRHHKQPLSIKISQYNWAKKAG